MNEELESQLSAMFDDELPQGECELLARRLSRDAALQARWSRYAAIAAAVRGGHLRLDCAVARKVNACGRGGCRRGRGAVHPVAAGRLFERNARARRALAGTYGCGRGHAGKLRRTAPGRAAHDGAGHGACELCRGA